MVTSNSTTKGSSTPRRVPASSLTHGSWSLSWRLWADGTPVLDRGRDVCGGRGRRSVHGDVPRPGRYRGQIHRPVRDRDGYARTGTGRGRREGPATHAD